MEFYRSKDEPDQLWRKDPSYPAGSEGPRWTIFFVAEDYHYLLDQDRFDDIPSYGIRGSKTVSGTNTVLSEFEENPDYSVAKIATCTLLGH